MNEHDTDSNVDPTPSPGADHGHDHGHHHGHGHHHDDPLHVQPTAHLDMDELDPANRSLAEALRASFFILFLVMVALVVSFLFSGTFSVDEGEVAIRLHFGAAVGGGQQVYEPGWHLAWPEPIDEIIKIPTSVQSLELKRPFWMQERPGEELKPLADRTVKQALEPGVDGYLLTGDQNIVHTRWTINYRVLKGREYDYARNVGTTERARALVQAAAEKGIVHLAAQVTADDFVRSKVDRSVARTAAQEVLRQLETGIMIDDVLLQRATVPLAVLPAVTAVTQAESQRSELISKANQEATKILGSSAGSAYKALEQAILYYERVRSLDDPPRLKAAEAVIEDLVNGTPARQALAPLVGDALLDADELQAAMTDDQVGGAVAVIISGAKAYKTKVVSDLRSEAQRFDELLADYRRNPRIVINRLWQDTKQEILSGDVEIFSLPTDPTKHLILQLNRDPRIQKARETKRYRNEPRPNE